MFIVSIALLLASIVALALYGLNFGVDFRGGSVMEVEFLKDRPDAPIMRDALSNDPAITELSVNTSGERILVIRSSPLSAENHQRVVDIIAQRFNASSPRELRFDSIGPAIGQELKSRSITAIVILLSAVLLYIAFMFRVLSRSISLWAMAVGTILGLAHDIIIPMGVFAVLGHFLGIQITAVYVAAVLTILGYTVSDKVVIYDRVRENILRGPQISLPEIVHRSVMQTLIRSINNTLVVMLSSLAVFLFGGESIRYFALALMLGIGLGAYSSIFVASPLLVWWSKLRKGEDRR